MTKKNHPQAYTWAISVRLQCHQARSLVKNSCECVLTLYLRKIDKADENEDNSRLIIDNSFVGSAHASCCARALTS